jgi:NTE family protein
MWDTSHRRLGQVATERAVPSYERLELPEEGAEARFRPACRAPAAQEKIAFVLAGGGALGAAHVGTLRALLEHGISPDFVVGTSVGALNGAALAQEPTLSGLDRLQDGWLRAGREIVDRDRRIVEIVHLASKRPSLYDSTSLRQIVSGMINILDLRDARIPVGVVATAVDASPERCYWSGPAVDLLMASCAIPAIFPPVTVDGITLIDGGVSNNIPLSHAVRYGATTIFVLLCGPRLAAPEEFGSRPFDHLLAAFALSRQSRVARDFEEAPAHVTVAVLPAPAIGKLFYTDLSRSGELIDQAYQLSSKVLDNLLAGWPVNVQDSVWQGRRRAWVPRLHLGHWRPKELPALS